MPVNFLLSVSSATLADFELKKLSDVANLRSELLALLDKYVEEVAQAGLIQWFRTQDRESLKSAIEHPPDVTLWAKEQIRKQGRKDAEEQGELPSPSLFRPSLPPGAAHLAAATRYAERNIAEGKCSECPKPLARHSVRFCETHLKLARERYRAKARAKGNGQRTNTCNPRRISLDSRQDGARRKPSRHSTRRPRSERAKHELGVLPYGKCPCVSQE